MIRWEAVKAVQRMQDFIANHVNEAITLHMLAKAANYSPWHAARIFKDLTGKTPFDYIRSLRLSRAADTLQHQDVRVIDIAFDFVFDSHEGFTRAFTREFGVSPHYFNKTKPAIRRFIPDNVRDYYLRLQKGEDTMAKNQNTATVYVQVVDRPARKLIFKPGVKATHYFEYCEEVGCDVWDVLSNIKEAMYEPIGMWMPENLRKPGTSEYSQGVEVPAYYAGVIPEGFDIIDLPPCKMMVFQGQPFDDKKYEEAISDIWSVMKAYQPELYGFEWADGDGPRFQLAPMGYRGYLEARPVRQIGS